MASNTKTRPCRLPGALMRYRCLHNKEREDSMGLMDRDYMKDTGRDRPFTPPPEGPLTGWLVKLVILVGLV